MGAIVVREAVKRAGINPADVDEVIMGCVVQAGLGQAPARQAALKADLPPEVSALTVNMVCGSGLRAVALAAQAMQTGRCGFRRRGRHGIDVEYPVCAAERRATVIGWATVRCVDLMIHDGLWCPFENWHMGNTGEVVAEKYQISREQQDDFAYNSHRKAMEARKEGRFKDEIVPIEIPQKKGDPVVFDYDETGARGHDGRRLGEIKARV